MKENIHRILFVARRFTSVSHQYMTVVVGFDVAKDAPRLGFCRHEKAFPPKFIPQTFSVQYLLIDGCIYHPPALDGRGLFLTF